MAESCRGMLSRLQPSWRAIRHSTAFTLDAMLMLVCRSENILALELDMPERVTYDILPGQGPDPRAQQAIDQAFWEDGHILLLAPPGGVQQQLHLAGPDMNSFVMQQKAASPVPGHQQRPSSGHPQRPGSARRQSGQGMQLR